ncbi:MAG: hypothetical protein ABI216_08100 [Devosia sp.]
MLLLDSSAQAAVTYAPDMGGMGGKPFDQGCKGTDVLVGVWYFAGKAMDAIAPVCQAVQAGHLIGEGYVGYYLGAGGGNGPLASRCPPDMAVKQMVVWWDGNGDVHHIRMICHVFIATPGVNVSVYTKQTQTSGGVPAVSGNSNCPSGSVATGIHGAYGTLVDRLGLKCDTYQISLLPPVAPPPVQDTTATPEPSPTPVPAPDPVQQAPQPQTRTAKDATTIYAKPTGKTETGYLNAGDTVTIITCQDNGEGWCEISAPKHGFVWGGDLNP